MARFGIDTDVVSDSALAAAYADIAAMDLTAGAAKPSAQPTLKI